MHKSSAYANIDAVTKKYKTNDGETVIALEDVSLTLKESEFVALVGPSGCGKSTLLSLLAGLETPTAGTIVVENVDLAGPNTRTGVVFQRDLLLPWRSVLDNVLLQFDLRGRRPPKAKERALELLEMVGIDGFAKKYPHQLSGGMRQRVAICRALVHDPPALLMDEPFGALDAITREQVARDLAVIAAETRKTVLFVTHSIEEATYLADRVLVMTSRPGRILEELTIPKSRPRDEWPDAQSDLGVYVSQARLALKGTS